MHIFLGYLRVRDWVRNNTGTFFTIPEPQPMDILFPADPEPQYPLYIYIHKTFFCAVSVSGCIESGVAG